MSKTPKFNEAWTVGPGVKVRKSGGRYIDMDDLFAKESVQKDIAKLHSMIDEYANIKAQKYTEIERKFRVIPELFSKVRGLSLTTEIKQTYLVSTPTESVRVRLEDNYAEGGPSKCTLTIKVGTGPIRKEYEFPFDGEEFWVLSKTYPTVKKHRFKFPYEGNNALCWEIDEFSPPHQGLIIAEIELSDINEEIILPEWIGEEVTYNADYYNCNIARNTMDVYR